jgi:peptide/nickel transport system permease protein
MLGFIAGRLISMILTLFAVSLVSFAIIQLPAGDFMTSYVANLAASGETIDQATVEALRERYGLGEPFLVQYGKWIGGILVGDFGLSFEWRVPVSELIWDRLGYSVLLEGITIILMWFVALPIGIYSAVRKYSIGDYVFTFFGFIGLAIPNFLLALILMYWSFATFGHTIGGLFSADMVNEPWSWARLVDFAAHAWAPILVLGTAGTAQLIRILRANLLDELHKPYVVTARAKGMKEWRLILKYPVRIAMNPLISTIGWILPTLVSSSLVTGVVMNLPVAGPMLLRSLMSQDMYLAGAFVLLLGVLTIVGTFISDILLALVDPRVRYGLKGRTS